MGCSSVGCGTVKKPHGSFELYIVRLQMAYLPQKWLPLNTPTRIILNMRHNREENQLSPVRPSHMGVSAVYAARTINGCSMRQISVCCAYCTESLV